MTIIDQKQVKVYENVNPPTETDDYTKGFRPCNIWHDTSANVYYICIKNTQNTSEWRQILDSEVNGSLKLDSFTPTLGQTIFTLSLEIYDAKAVCIFYNGLLLENGVDVTINSSTQIEWLNYDGIVLTPDDLIECLYSTVQDNPDTQKNYASAVNGTTTGLSTDVWTKLPIDTIFSGTDWSTSANGIKCLSSGKFYISMDVYFDSPISGTVGVRSRMLKNAVQLDNTFKDRTQEQAYSVKRIVHSEDIVDFNVNDELSVEFYAYQLVTSVGLYGLSGSYTSIHVIAYKLSNI